MTPTEPPMDLRFVIPSMAHWREYVSQMTNADMLNNGLKLLYLAKSRDNIHPFRDNELDHARNILYKHARSLPVNKYSAGWRDQQAPLMAKSIKNMKLTELSEESLQSLYFEALGTGPKANVEVSIYPKAVLLMLKDSGGFSIQNNGIMTFIGLAGGPVIGFDVNRFTQEIQRLGVSWE